MAPRARADFKVPSLTGAVVDDAQLMDPDARETLDRELRQLWQQGGSQIAVLTVDDLGGESIEQASIAVTDQWKLGKKGTDNGVLLMVAKQEHSVRIEVGQGLEGQLTDIYSHRIIADVIIPYFKAGDPTSGIVAGVQAIVRYTDPGYQLGLHAAPRPRHSDDVAMPPWMFFVLLFIILFWLHRARRYGGRRYYGGWWGGGGGGGWGGGGGGGGGFSGGGGGFSGGGSSGQW